MKFTKTLAILLALLLALGSAAFAAGSFTDVAEDAYYADAVEWAVEKGVTTGRRDGIFDPDATVTRAEAVTFLWRMAGEPAPTKTESFPDVEADEGNWWYKEAVQWAVENGITNGTGEGFSPYVTCSRGMILTMLYRMEGEPLEGLMDIVLPVDQQDWTLEDIGTWMVQTVVDSLRKGELLSDVEEGAYYELPIAWAVLSGVLDENQVDEDSPMAQPEAPCPRGEMVYFLYRASGDAPARAAKPRVEVGTIDETVALDKDNVKITITGIECDEYGDPRLTATIVNGTDKYLEVGCDECFVNSFLAWPQVYIPVTSEDGWTFYSEVIPNPGETMDFFINLGNVEDMGIDAIRELELRLTLTEVETDEDGFIGYVDDFADGEALHIKTSLFDAAASYDMEGTTVYDKDGLTLKIVKAENAEFGAPQIFVYAYNSGSEEVALEIKELKLDGVAYDSFLAMNIPAGRRSVEQVSIDIDYSDPPVAKEVTITFRTVDPETWEPAVTLDPVTVALEAAA